MWWQKRALTDFCWIGFIQLLSCFHATQIDSLNSVTPSHNILLAGEKFQHVEKIHHKLKCSTEKFLRKWTSSWFMQEKIKSPFWVNLFTFAFIHVAAVFVQSYIQMRYLFYFKIASLHRRNRRLAFKLSCFFLFQMYVRYECV